MKIKFLKEENYIQIFNYKDGKSIIIEKEPFQFRERGPLLLDVSITNRCYRQCEFCYRRSNDSGKDISLEDYRVVLSEAKKCGVQQIAIGGGEPTVHPEFIEILRETFESGIVPNYSTNADALNDEIINATKKYCGAIAISVYDDIEKYESIVEKIVSFDIKVNFHFILRKDKLKYYANMLKNPPKWFEKINAIIFLNYKPVHGDENQCLKYTSEDSLRKFFKVVQNFKLCGIGFDTCSISFVCSYMEIDDSLYDYCESSRKSAYINEKLEVYPCSFYTKNGASLRENSLIEIWNSHESFINHRLLLMNKICDCSKSESCHGGCPIYKINKCDTCNV